MIRKLRLKFICVNMLIVTLMLTAIFGMVYHLTRQGLETQSEAMLQSVASDAFHPNRPGSPPQEVHLPFFVLELDGNGGLTASGGGYYDLTDQEFLKTLADVATDADAPAGVLREYGLRYCRSVTPRGERIAFADMSSERATLKNLTETCAAIGVLCFAAFLLISWLLARWAVKPVETAWQQQRQFVADASHELKTPLTVILSSADLLAESAPAEEQTYVENIRAESRRMKKLVEEMLTLFRAESVRRETAFSEVDLSDVVTDAALRFEPVVVESGRRLLYTIDEGLQVSGDRDALERLTGILLDNAVKYAPQGTDIRLTLTHQDRTACLAVENGGDPIPPEVAAHLFDRFYRADSSRTGTGFGLGLAIARAIVQNHRGNIICRSQEGLNRFSVMLPVLRQKEAQ